ncbi:FISUMP domain-containing protein [Sulfurovum sp. AR]|uniref:FISUMP domain-containing protein n=1 Tax=Sulfurovum sp. AR TaxID=1165841 RepID=UPI00025C4F82|nr:FISUMP domain-containing protein [Sulfurovum sp. AR]EIF51177.1 hypothetical protein SULAR_04783 [Sulfurovum sp. AR]
MDRNLGASQAATETNDSLAYGDYYQWGRYADGHEKNDSEVCDAFLATDLNDSNTSDWYAQFIVPPSGPHDWVAADVDDNGSLRSASWNTPYDDNQVCPCGYVVATENDFKDLNITDTNVSNDFKLAYAGYRSPDSSLGGVDTMAIYWTSDTNDTNGRGSIPYDLIGDGRASDHKRAYGLPIRCIKPQ